MIDWLGFSNANNFLHRDVAPSPLCILYTKLSRASFVCMQPPRASGPYNTDSGTSCANSDMRLSRSFWGLMLNKIVIFIFARRSPFCSTFRCHEIMPRHRKSSTLSTNASRSIHDALAPPPFFRSHPLYRLDSTSLHLPMSASMAR